MDDDDDDDDDDDEQREKDRKAAEEREREAAEKKAAAAREKQQEKARGKRGGDDEITVEDITAIFQRAFPDDELNDVCTSPHSLSVHFFFCAVDPMSFSPSLSSSLCRT
jgi:hypothetical protein